MFSFLRFIRGFCGVLFVIQIIGLLPVISWLQQPDAITGKMLAQVFIKMIVLAFWGAIFFGMRYIINWLYSKKLGIPHPALQKKLAL